MGNLCSGRSTDKDGSKHADGSRDGQQQRTSQSISAAPATPVDIALRHAKVELVKNKGVFFHDHYLLTKLIGHGAFAKVWSCSHRTTNEVFACKAVVKSVDDPAKQRDGECSHSSKETAYSFSTPLRTQLRVMLVGSSDTCLLIMQQGIHQKVRVSKGFTNFVLALPGMRQPISTCKQSLPNILQRSSRF